MLTTGPRRTWPRWNGAIPGAIARWAGNTTAPRPFLAGLFYWTGFDYRGESTPFGKPAISSRSGILDTCGFPKDSYYYLKAAWIDQPLVHIFPALELAGQGGAGH